MSSILRRRAEEILHKRNGKGAEIFWNEPGKWTQENGQGIKPSFRDCEFWKEKASKLCRVPTAGVIISRAIQNVPDYGHQRKVGLPKDVGWDNEFAQEASVFNLYLSQGCDGMERTRWDPGGYRVPPGRHEWAGAWKQNGSLTGLLSGTARGIASTYASKGWEREQGNRAGLPVS
jgi:hypothetical protein